MIRWICRQWTRRYGEWTSDIDVFTTEAEAREQGRAFVLLRAYEDDERVYEVYAEEAPT